MPLDDNVQPYIGQFDAFPDNFMKWDGRLKDPRDTIREKCRNLRSGHLRDIPPDIDYESKDRMRRIIAFNTQDNLAWILYRLGLKICITDEFPESKEWYFCDPDDFTKIHETPKEILLSDVISECSRNSVPINTVDYHMLAVALSMIT
jgi:hypothetical protein